MNGRVITGVIVESALILVHLACIVAFFFFCAVEEGGEGELANHLKIKLYAFAFVFLLCYLTSLFTEQKFV